MLLRQKHETRFASVRSGNRYRGQVEKPAWTFLSNHAHVLVCLARDPDVRLRDVAELVGITERAAQMLVSDLEEAGYVRRERVGRRNRYHLTRRTRLRHPLEDHVRVGDLLDVLVPR